MKKYFLLLLIPGFIAIHAIAQTASPIIDSATFLLHKFAQPIGKEHYTLTADDTGFTWAVDFKFVDRGSAVPLKARLSTTKDFEPRSLLIKGNTSRMSTINDSLYISGDNAMIRVDDSSYTKTLQPLSFPVGGYSPGTVQMILLQYWKHHHQPEIINLLPAGSVRISKDGHDTLSFMDKPLLLERYVIGGLIWGNELVWIDRQGRLVCLITNDAEGDKLEMMLEPYESLLPELISKAATYGMQLFSASSGLPAQRQDRILAIVGADLPDLTGKPTLKNSTVLVRNGRIERIGRTTDIKIPANATVIHGEGKCLLPGLWDMHAHFEQAEWGPAYLAAGVTTVRDCGNEFDYINAIQEAIDGGKGIGPHILKAGIIDGPGPNGIGIIRAATKEEAIKAVQRYKDNGFTQIKIYSAMQPDIVKAVCVEAHRLGLSVTGHIPEGMNLLQGVDSGMDMVNHIPYVYSVMKHKKDLSIDLEDSTNQQVLHFIKTHNVVIDPTLGVYEMMLRSVKDDITMLEPAFYTLPVPLQEIFRNMGMLAAQAEKYKPWMQSMKVIVKALHDEGVNIVAGTDMGFPGYSIDRELELYVDCGLSPLEAIQTATIIPARVMHRDKQNGSIEAGKQADLILIDGDPLQHISDLRKVTMVIKDGRIYYPSALHKMVGFSD